MNRRPFVILLAVAFLQATPSPAQTGLLVVAHGANHAWNAQVRQTVSQVAWPHGSVATAFLMGDEAESSGWDRAVRQLEEAGSRRIIVVPLMVSSHGSHYRQVRHYAGELPELPPEIASHNHGTAGLTTVPIRVTAALDDAPEVATALAERWAGAASPETSKLPLVLLGHGPQSDEDLARWQEAFGGYARVLARSGYGGEIRAQFLRDDAAPPVRADAIQLLRDTVTAMAARAGDSVTVMTVLIATGPMTSARIPRDISGLPVRYLPIGVTPHPAIARWIGRVATEAMNEVATQAPTAR